MAAFYKNKGVFVMAKNNLCKATSVVIKREIESAVMRDRLAFSETATDVIINMTLVSLHDEFGFGKKRLIQFQEKLQSHADCIVDGYVSIEELKLLADELRTKIENYR